MVNSRTYQLILIATTLAVSFVPARAELWLKSDLPLVTKSHQLIWPKDCSTKDAFASCSRFALGNWRVRYADCSDCDTWLNLDIPNFNGEGGMSYAETVHETDDPDPAEPAGLILLTPEKSGGGIYAFEIGFRGGSRYVLVSAQNDGKTVERASVLDVRCHPEWKGVSWRKSKEAETFIIATGYCVVTSIDQLTRMAEEALDRAPIATLQWVERQKTGSKHDK